MARHLNNGGHVKSHYPVPAEITDMMLRISLPKLLAAVRKRLATPFLRNLGSMGTAQLVTRISRLLTALILSHLQIPADFGLAAMVLTVYELIALFTRNGITAKVIQALDTEGVKAAGTAYRLTWSVSIILMFVQGLITIPVVHLYHAPRLALPIALMGLIYLSHAALRPCNAPSCNARVVWAVLPKPRDQEKFYWKNR